MREGLFWLTDNQWAPIEPHLPTGLTGPVREDNWRIISGIVHMLKSGERWRYCPLNTALTQPSTIASIVGPCVDGSGLARVFFTHAAVVGAAIVFGLLARFT